ncbi:hypothetical protein [Bacillus sp. FJAT-27225]|uniref:hypothetical protein n=1 Tax=Bacillus sp. FJAT-27225 TaxID=1743144 RepID=UPI001111F11F|nr:hypothetical protein [Bacillus sp. FJAT-27225]
MISFEGNPEEGTDYYRVYKWSIISPDFQSAILSSNITGFHLKEILIDDEKGNLLNTDLKQMEVSGRGGLLTNLKGNEIPNCPLCHRVSSRILDKEDGLSINLDSWDGTDIFFFNNWKGTVIVSERVKALLQNHNLTNIDFINIREYVFNRILKRWRNNSK